MFKIDHPLDPANKYLSHSFVESPDMLNVYSGTASLDGDGEAEVELPDWFEALNRDVRYQLTAVGSAAPDLHVKNRVDRGRFMIAGGRAGQEVSWQLTGIRQDAYAKEHPIVVEQAKTGADKGKYLHPELFGKPASKGAASSFARAEAAEDADAIAGLISDDSVRRSGGILGRRDRFRPRHCPWEPLE